MVPTPRRTAHDGGNAKPEFSCGCDRGHIRHARLRLRSAASRTHGDEAMTKGEIIAQYRTMSEADRRTFDRWLKLNMVIGSLFTAALLFMAFGGPDLVAPNAAVAQSKGAAGQTGPGPGRPKCPVHLSAPDSP